MSVRIYNPYPIQVIGTIVFPDGSTDGIHIQPGAAINLPLNAELYQNTLVEYPRLQRIASTPAPQFVYDTPNSIASSTVIGISSEGAE